MTFEEFLDECEKIDGFTRNYSGIIRNIKYKTNSFNSCCPILAVAIAKGVCNYSCRYNFKYVEVAKLLGLEEDIMMEIVSAADHSMCMDMNIYNKLLRACKV